MYKPNDFSNFVTFVKDQCERGYCTKEEASMAILDKAQEIILSLKMPTTDVPEEEKYQFNTYN
jgi:hypothetical protein